MPTLRVASWAERVRISARHALDSDINDFGVITGRSATDPATGIRSAILATPIDHHH
jgi:hypothetical protein